MRKILQLLCILSNTIVAKAQIGKWTPGYYYDQNNSKNTGEIKWSAPSMALTKGKGDEIRFRPAGSDENDKVEIEKVKSFVLKTDSFVVSHDAQLVKCPVLYVLINNPLKLYVNLRQSSSSGYGIGGFTGPALSLNFLSSAYSTRYFYGENPDDLKELSRSNFIDVMSQIMADNNGIVQAIKNKEYRYGNMSDLVKQYKIFKEHPVE